MIYDYFPLLSPEARMLRKNAKICVDFDGVLHSYTSKWCGIDCIPDPPVEGAIDWLQYMLPSPEDEDPLGMELREFQRTRRPVPVIYSSRSRSIRGRKAMKDWLIYHGLPRGYIRDGILLFPTKKPISMMTIDDRAFCFEGRFPSMSELRKFKPWNRR